VNPLRLCCNTVLTQSTARVGLAPGRVTCESVISPARLVSRGWQSVSRCCLSPLFGATERLDLLHFLR